jgi:hypothetical protein
VVVGTAGAVRHHQDQKYAQQNAAAQQQYAEQDAAAQQQMEAAQQQAYEQGLADAAAQATSAQQPAPAPVAAAAGPDLTSQLQQLAQLHDAGVLTDQEFAAAKQKILAG